MRRPLKHKGDRPAYIKKQEDAKHEEGDRQKHQQYIEAIHAIADQFATEQQQDSTNDRRRAFREKLTIGLLVATVLAAGLGDWFFYGQREEMVKSYRPLKDSADAAKKSADEASKITGATLKQIEIADQQQRLLNVIQRPWVSFTNPEIVSDLTVEKTVAKATFHVTIQNTGQLPAENVTTYFELVAQNVSDHTGTTTAIRSAICERRKKAPLSYNAFGYQWNGQVLFPGDKMPWDWEMTIGTEGLNKIRAERPGGTIFWIIVCIDYKMILQENDRHQTSHIFLLTDKGGGVISLQEERVVPKSELRVSWDNKFGTLAD